MGLLPFTLRKIDRVILEYLGGFEGKKMLELGDQVIIPEESIAVVFKILFGTNNLDLVDQDLRLTRDELLLRELHDRSLIKEKTCKEYFEKKEMIHTSFDLNGKHGSLKVDLSKAINDERWLGHFDVITNIGTSEHIEPLSSQYEVFMNIHNMLKVGGIAIHTVPVNRALEKDLWIKHCNNYYSLDFFDILSQQNNYSILEKDIEWIKWGGIWVCLQKNEDIPFMKDREELLKHILRTSGGTIYPGINDQSWRSRLKRIFSGYVNRKWT